MRCWPSVWDSAVEPEVAGRAHELLLALQVRDEIAEAVRVQAEALRPLARRRRLESGRACLGRDALDRGLGLRVEPGRVLPQSHQVAFHLDCAPLLESRERALRSFRAHVLG